MATGWWAALWSWTRPLPRPTASEPVQQPEPVRQTDRAPDDGSRPALPPEADAPPTDDQGARHRAEAAPPPRRSALVPPTDPGHGTPLRPLPTTTGAPPVAQLDNVIADLLAIEGANGAAIVDIDSGMALATGGAPGFDLNVAAAGNSNVVRAKLRTISDLELKDEIEDILITLAGQYHLINVLKGQGNAGLFIYLVLDRATANLALARHKLRAVAGSVSV